MATFEINSMSDSSVLGLVDMRDAIKIDPDYQRPGGVWSLKNKQLFIDSLINRYDIPKFYFHYLAGINAEDGFRYAIIDGRQRLEAVWDFFDGRFALAEDFVYSDNSNIAAQNMTYSELSEKYPRVLSKLHARTLSVQVVIADDLDFIEDMFSRLNDAVPLNAAEKRNAFGGPLPQLFRDLVSHRFFVQKIKISEKRYRHHDIAAKMVYLQNTGEFVDTKKASLDYFVKSFKGQDSALFDQVSLEVRQALDKLAGIFADSDPLLRSAGMVIVYYVLISRLISEKSDINFGRAELQQFEDKRTRNREKFAAEEKGVDFKLIEFDELTQSSNDGSAIQRRYELLRSELGV